MLFAHAIKKMINLGKPATSVDGFADKPYFNAQLKNVSFTGTLHANVKIGANGEILTPYKLYNFDGSAWKVVGNWDLAAGAAFPPPKSALSIEGGIGTPASKLYFSDGTTIVPPSTNRITIGVMVKSLHSTLHRVAGACFQHVNQNTTLLAGNRSPA